MSSLDNSHTFWHTILYIVAKVVYVCYTFLFAQFFFPGTAIGDFFGRGAVVPVYTPGGLWPPLPMPLVNKVYCIMVHG